MNGGTSPFAERLSTAIAQLGVSFRGLALQCAQRGAAVSAPTLRAWAGGASRPHRRSSFATVEVLEQVLGLDAGELRQHLRAESTSAGDEEAYFAQLHSDLDTFAQVHGAAGQEDMSSDLISSVLHLRRTGEALLQHRLMLTARNAGLSRVVVPLHRRYREFGEIRADFGELVASGPLGAEYLAVVVELPRPLEAQELALVDLTAVTTGSLEVPDRFCAIAPHRAGVVVAGLRTPGHGYLPVHCSRTEIGEGGPRVREEHVDMLPGTTGTQAVSRHVRGAEMAVAWGTPEDQGMRGVPGRPRDGGEVGAA